MAVFVIRSLRSVTADYVAEAQYFPPLVYMPVFWLCLVGKTMVSIPPCGSHRLPGIT